MLIGKPHDIPSSEITPKKDYEAFMSRRKFLRGAALAGTAALGAERVMEMMAPGTYAFADAALKTVPSPLTTTGEQLTSLDDITHFNNFYEFGVEKDQPAKNAGVLPTRPWAVKITGKVKKPQTFDIDTLMSLKPLEDRVYRHRCVEAWSMVIPWVGYSLSELINRCEPLPSAKFIQFVSYFDPKVERWSDESTISWPYLEGLRMDEAMNPLTLLTFGLYGEVLPNQNGAPVRVVLPWKYGYKSAKSIVEMKFVSDMPATTWNMMAPDEYGFYSNVNPNVDHPRWSQKSERRIGLPFYEQRRATLMFNGYTDFVASMYKGMDLRQWH